MRNFFNSHWKVILAILLAIMLAVLTVDTTSGEPSLAARLQAHTQALASGTTATGGALRHVETSLRRAGYAPRMQRSGDTAHPGHSIEVTVSRLAPNGRPDRTFIVGAHLGRDAAASAAGAAAVLELARAARTLGPAYGTEVRFVFFVDDDRPAGEDRRPGAGRRDGGNFMAFVGTRAASHQVRQALAALRSDPMLARQGLAAPAHVMGLTLSGHGSGPDDGPALVITDTGFLRFPYFRAEAPPGPAQGQEQAQDLNDYDGMARIVGGLGRTLEALAGAVDI
ncbi:hypothetical protein [Massilia sp. HP4]|uniref:hypothetical protein n=1 Tax=Massilia sp. HP4 TaxID=2562316 RepID=UPI0010C0B5EC|nr:hypothetical protein [Massilia sp. HP4]